MNTAPIIRVADRVERTARPDANPRDVNLSSSMQDHWAKLFSHLPSEAGDEELATLLKWPLSTFRYRKARFKKEGLLQIVHPESVRGERGRYQPGNDTLESTILGSQVARFRGATLAETAKIHRPTTLIHRHARLAENCDSDGDPNLGYAYTFNEGTYREIKESESSPPAMPAARSSSSFAQDSSARDSRVVESSSTSTIRLRARSGQVTVTERPPGAGVRPDWMFGPLHTETCSPLAKEQTDRRRGAARKAFRRALPDGLSDKEIAALYNAYRKKVLGDLPAFAVRLTENWSKLVEYGFGWRTQSLPPKAFDPKFACAHASAFVEAVGVMRDDPQSFDRQIRRNRDARFVDEADLPKRVEREKKKAANQEHNDAKVTLKSLGLGSQYDLALAAGRYAVADFMVGLAKVGDRERLASVAARIDEAESGGQDNRKRELWSSVRAEAKAWKAQKDGDENGEC